jgi:serine protease Do
LLTLAGSALAQSLPREARINILDAVVQVVPYDPQTDGLVNWSGSGSIISPSGYILTNYHVVGDLDRRTTYEWHLIFITGSEFTDMPPEPVFWAQYIAGDPTHDLAILKIREWLDEEPVADDYRFPHVQVGDSNQLLPGDYITIVGYPGVSGSTITFTAGLMSGWLGEDMETGGRQWIKTDGKIAHGNSGGGAFDESGYLIGVPTAGRTVQWAELDVEEQAYVRPISLAWALIGPHVPDVARAAGAQTTGTSGQTASGQSGTQPGSQTTQQATQPSASSTGCEFCFVGNIGVGQVATHSIVGLAEGINYHTYGVEVPEGATSVVINLWSDFDVDVAVKYGSDIQSWSDTGDWDYRDISENYGGSFTITNPRPGTWYVDVIFFYEGGSAVYELSVR